MRLFIALMLPEEAGKKVMRFTDELKFHDIKGRFVNMSDLHITLAFIGDYEDPETVIGVLENIVFTPMNISLNDWSIDRNGLIRLIPEQNEALEELVRAIRKSLKKNGIPFDNRRFVPHVTVSRKTRGLSGLKGREISVNIAFDTDTFSLMCSELRREGSSYTELCSFSTVL